MAFWLDIGLLRMAAIVVAGLWAFVSFGSLASHLVGSVFLQVGVAGSMGVVTASVVNRVVTTSEIPRMLSSTRRPRRPI